MLAPRPDPREGESTEPARLQIGATCSVLTPVIQRTLADVFIYRMRSIEPDRIGPPYLDRPKAKQTLYAKQFPRYFRQAALLIGIHGLAAARGSDRTESHQALGGGASG